MSMRRGLVLFSVLVPTFLEILDMTIVNVSLYHIGGNLGASIQETTWVISGYLMSNAITMALSGRIAEFLGKRNYLLISIGGFTIASVLCGVSPNLPALVLCRVVQGAFGGGLQPLSLTLIAEVFEQQEQPRTIAIWAQSVSAAPLVGPVLGGFITDQLGWRWIFLLNLPIGVISYLVVNSVTRNSKTLSLKSRDRIDVRGAYLLIIALASLQMVIERGNEVSWFSSKLITGLAIMCIFAFLLFVFHSLKNQDTILDIRILKHPIFCLAVILLFFVSFTYSGMAIVFPILLQSVFGFSVAQAGAATIPRAAVSLILIKTYSRLIRRVHPLTSVAVGCFLCAISADIMSRYTVHNNAASFLPPLILQGIASGLMFVPLTLLSTQSVPKNNLGNAVGLTSLLRSVGGSLGIAVATVILNSSTQSFTARLNTTISQFDHTTRSTLANLVHSRAPHNEMLRDRELSVADFHSIVHTRAMSLAYTSLFMDAASCFAALALMCLALRVIAEYRSSRAIKEKLLHSPSL